MTIVLDTNIVFSVIAKANGRIAKIFFHIPSFAQYCAPDFLVEEIQLHRNKLIRISGLSELNFEKAKTSVFSNINFVDPGIIPAEYFSEAVSLTKDIDFKDFQFVALALAIDGMLWTGDKKLYKGLQRKNFRNIMNASDINSTFGLNT